MGKRGEDRVPQQRPPDPETAAGDSAASGPPDPLALLRSRSYVVLLVFAAALGAPIAAAAYFFLSFVGNAQDWVFHDLPEGLGFDQAPMWWPVLPLVVAGVLVAAIIRYLPGNGGHIPVEGFHASGPPFTGKELPGVLLAALATLALGAVVGPEAPLIALGGGLAALAIRLLRRGAPEQAVAMVAAAGSFAAISALLGSPLVGAFLLMEASGLGGAMLSLVLVPGLLCAGIGALVFIGLDTLTGLGTQSLAIPDLPPFARPDIAEFGWALAIGVAAAVLGTSIRRGAVALRPFVERRRMILTPLIGLATAGLAIGYASATDKPSSDVLFSGQDALDPLFRQSASYSVGALLLLLLCKGGAYAIALCSFRGGPVFPAVFLGAAGGILLSHLPGLPLVAGVAMGIGAMCAVMLKLPLTSVLLAAVLLAADGLTLVPLIIVAVVVAHVTAAHLEAPPSSAPAAPTHREPTPTAVPAH